MKIKSLVIENFKSIERIELVEPNPFTVFVGPNGSGKSNIFEALEFGNYIELYGAAQDLFGGSEAINNRKKLSIFYNLTFEIKQDNERFGAFFSAVTAIPKRYGGSFHTIPETWSIENSSIYRSFSDLWFKHFTRLFINSPKGVRINLDTSERLREDGKNIEKVLRRILQNPILRDEISEWLELFIPGFKAVEVDDRNELRWFEQSSSEYFTKDLISDGTYNILALLTAVYQSDEPQFLCIEEPENGLHPQVAAELVDFFRTMCEERGHYIWLNTHSQSMASRVRPNEFVVVEKKQGATTVRQFRNEDFNGMSVDEAWLTNALNGGLAW